MPSAERLLEQAFGPAARPELGVTSAVVVVRGGRSVVARYGPGVAATDTLPSWSMAKSVLAALVGIAIGEGRGELDEPVGWPGWPATDPRSAITVRQLLRMTSGLAWTEDYDPTPNDPGVGTSPGPGRSDVVEMLYGPGRADVAGYAASRTLDHRPGRRFCYSSGTSNLLAWWLGTKVGTGPEGIGRWADERLFAPCGMASPVLKFDDAGTWIGSTYCFATAADFVRFGLLHLTDGVVTGGADGGEHRVLPEGWVAACTTPHPAPGEEPWGYGLHWWTRPELGGCYAARGFRAQLLLVAPALDLVLVRLGVTDHHLAPHVHAWCLELAAACADR